MKAEQKSPITERKGSFYLRKHFEGKQREVALGSDKKTAISRANRFIATATASGYDTAMAELRGRPCIKAGCNPTIDEIEILYREFCNQSAKPPRPETIKHNIARLKCIMTRAGVKKIGHIKKNTLFKDWFKGTTATPAEKRTFASAIKAAQSVFKKSALAYYEAKGIKMENPFDGLELVAPKVTQFIPPSNEILETILGTLETELKPHDAMIVLLAFCGLRRAEIEAVIPSNFSKQSDKVLLNIEETGAFQPKANQDGFVPITLEAYAQLLRLRGKSSSPFFVPGTSKKVGKGRLWERIHVVNHWLKGKGLKNKPLHSCRKITGSIVAKSQGILEAAKVLRNTPQVCMVNYLGVAEVSTVDVQGSLKPKDPLEETAKMFNLTVEQLKEKLSVN